ncbi:MAG: DNA-processing protein DprA [Chloroflexota bacterium]
MDEQAKYPWVALSLVKGIGAARMRLLLDRFGSPAAAWQAAPPELEAAGLSARLVEALVSARRSGAAERTWEMIRRLQIQVLTWDDPAYPRRLAEVDNSPPVLYVRGRLDDADSLAVGIVGTRRVTAYGRQVTAELTEALVRSGLTIVSGLARGVDGIAHETAVKSGGRTLAVLGSGVDQIYPPEHRRLAAQMLGEAGDGAHGAIISDYPPGATPEAANFPPRNRIISGLSQAVVVVEAGEKSGALITAAFAVEQGRQVFAVPGSVYAPQSRGANRLIQQGARLLLNAQDLLEALNLYQAGQQRSARAALPADATEAQLYGLLSHEPLHVDEIRYRAGLPIDQVTAALTLMELKGLVRQVGSMHYIAVSEGQADYTV